MGSGGGGTMEDFLRQNDPPGMAVRSGEISKIIPCLAHLYNCPLWV